MSMSKFNILICLSMIALLCSNFYTYAQTVEAKVLKCTEKEISLELSSQAPFKIGDAIDVGYMMGSMGESLIGTYKVTSLNGEVVGAGVVRSVMPASQDMNVVVYPSTEQPLIDNLFSKDYGQKPRVVYFADVQKSLKDLGYDPGEINGLLSEKTERAVRAFQKDAGLPVDGKITLGLADSLYQELNSFERFSKKEQESRPNKATGKNATAQPRVSQPQSPKVDFGNAFDDF